jgi:hypothetical protein
MTPPTTLPSNAARTAIVAVAHSGSLLAIGTID